ncbi:MAG: type III pantothenate kinase [Flavobacteriales bacterium]|nr:type III pantothenate kinase [Flavobacteriales bacterium]
MNLVVDVGNTLVKFAVFEENKLLHKETCIISDFKKILEKIAFDFPNIQKAAIGIVGGFSTKNVDRLKKLYTLYTITSETKVPFVNAYKTPTSLGLDRIALATAAFETYPNEDVLIIDVGTCITYDFISAKGIYKGGAISPGINMRYKALHTFTERLPLLDVNIPKDILGNSTATSIHSGVLFGVAFEIDGVIGRYKEDFRDLTVILTGGNAHFLRDSLKNSIFANSNFLLEGLNFLLEFNQDT